MVAKEVNSSKIFNIQRNSSSSSKVVLNYLELYYIRLYTHGLEYSEICKFLEMDYFKTYNILRGIKRKYNTSNWVEIITKVFNSNHLNKIDFINDTVKENALAYTQTIYQNCFKNSGCSISSIPLEIDLTEYFFKCESLLSKTYNDNDKSKNLTLVETQLLNLRFKGKSKAEILVQLEITEPVYKCLIKKIHTKLEANNWFNVYKKAFQFNILNKTEEHFLFLASESSNTAKKILSLKHAIELGENEKKLSIYNELLEFYSCIEFSYLNRSKKSQVKNLKENISISSDTNHYRKSV